mmetsp:Transcript_15921/g.67113  ORF Transcript_15921/g.67113 Transcript_15921/m.67113 type:complete len:219 (-) Transcript_15921:1343-1999(-)
MLAAAPNLDWNSITSMSAKPINAMSAMDRNHAPRGSDASHASVCFVSRASAQTPVFPALTCPYAPSVASTPGMPSAFAEASTTARTPGASVIRNTPQGASFASALPVAATHRRNDDRGPLALGDAFGAASATDGTPVANRGPTASETRFLAAMSTSGHVGSGKGTRAASSARNASIPASVAFSRRVVSGGATAETSANPVRTCAATTTVQFNCSIVRR